MSLYIIYTFHKIIQALKILDSNKYWYMHYVSLLINGSIILWALFQGLIKKKLLELLEIFLSKHTRLLVNCFSLCIVEHRELSLVNWWLGWGWSFLRWVDRHHLHQIAVEVKLALLVREGLLEMLTLYIVEEILHSLVAQYILQFVEHLKVLGRCMFLTICIESFW